MNRKQRVHLFFGDDDFPRDTAAREVVARLVPEAEQAFGLDELDGAAGKADEAAAILKSTLGALQTRGFLGPGRVVWLCNASFLGDGNLMKNAAVKELVQALAGELACDRNADNTLLITAPKIDKRSVLYKACTEHGEVHEFAVPEKGYLVEQQAKERTRDCFRARGIEAGENVVEEFVGRVGPDMRQLVSEADKLDLYLGERRKAMSADVAAIVSPGRNVMAWDLADAVGNRELGRALALTSQLLYQKEKPTRLAGTVASRVRELLAYQEALARGWSRLGGYKADRAEWGRIPPDDEDVFAAAFDRDPRSQHSFRVAKLAEQARKYQRAELLRAQRLALSTFEQLVTTGTAADIRLQILLIQITRRRD